MGAACRGRGTGAGLGYEHTLGRKQEAAAGNSNRSNARQISRTISTFSCDMTRAVCPTLDKRTAGRDTRRLMSQKSVEIVRGVYDGWFRGDVTSALQYLDPEIVWEAIADAPDAGTYRGHAGCRRYMEDWLDDFDMLSMDFEEVIGADDLLVIAQCGRTKGRGSGIETELRYAVAYRLRSGKVVEVKEFRTKTEALEAAGLHESEKSL